MADTQRKYIGARYVPLIMGEWDSTATYEPLSVVLYEGNSYTSRTFVPAGIPIDNDVYWALSGNVVGTPTDAQVESAVSDWLDNHPEATTTVEDGSITNAKIADGTITNAKLVQSGGVLSDVDSLNLRTNGLIDESNITYSIGAIDLNGDLDSSNPNYYASEFIKTEAEKRIRYKLFATTTVNVISFYDSSKTFISGVSGIGASTGKEWFVDIPQNTTYVRFCTTIASIQNSYIIIEPNINDDIALIRNTTMKRSRNLANKAEFIDQAWMDNAGVITYNNATYFITLPIAVESGETYTANSTCRFVTLFDANGDVVTGTIQNVTQFTVPQNVSSVVVTGYRTYIDSFMLAKETKALSYEPYYVLNDVEKPRKIVVFGDSWTDIVNTTYTRWPVIVNALDEFDVSSYGVTGSNISTSITSQIASFTSDNIENVDTFILMGGINDYRGNVTIASIVSAVQSIHSTLIAAYPNARFIYIANNQLYFSEHQLNYFNSIVNQLVASGIESYTSFAWAPPSLYATDFLHLGNDGNVCLANNVLALLRGGLPITYVNRKHFDIYNDSAQRIGQFNICEMYANGYPELKVKANFGSAMANTTKTFTIDQRDFFTSAPWALFPYQLNDITKRCHIHSPYSETLGTSNMVNSFEVTLVVTSAGATFTTENGIGINFSA